MLRKIGKQRRDGFCIRDRRVNYSEIDNNHFSSRNGVQVEKEDSESQTDFEKSSFNQAPDFHQLM
jgi:hypothetical protein